MTTEGIKILNMYFEDNHKRARKELEGWYSEEELKRIATAASIIDYLRNNDLKAIKENQDRNFNKLLTIYANIETLLGRQQ